MGTDPLFEDRWVPRLGPDWVSSRGPLLRRCYAFRRGDRLVLLPAGFVNIIFSLNRRSIFLVNIILLDEGAGISWLGDSGQWELFKPRTV